MYVLIFFVFSFSLIFFLITQDLIIVAANSERKRISDDGNHYESWIKNIAVFTGILNYHLNMDLTGILQYTYNQMKVCNYNFSCII